MFVYLRTAFQVPSIILTSFRQRGRFGGGGGGGGGGGLFYPPPPPSPTSKQNPKKPTQIRVNTTTWIYKLMYKRSCLYIKIYKLIYKLLYKPLI